MPEFVRHIEIFAGGMRAGPLLEACPTAGGYECAT